MNKIKLAWAYVKTRAEQNWKDLKDGVLLGQAASRRELIWAMLIVYLVGECQ